MSRTWADMAPPPWFVDERRGAGLTYGKDTLVICHSGDPELAAQPVVCVVFRGYEDGPSRQIAQAICDAVNRSAIKGKPFAMNIDKILEAVDGTLVLARSRGIDSWVCDHEPIEYKHLTKMREQMGEPGFDIGKANRWLGYIQGVVMANSVSSDAGPVELEELKSLNRTGEGPQR